MRCLTLAFGFCLVMTHSVFAAVEPSVVCVAPLLTTEWGQTTANNNPTGTRYVYNYYTPNHDPCGCVATALAQVLYYHGSTKTVVARSFDCAVDGETSVQTLKGGTYDWESMPPKPFDVQYTLTDAQKQAIGKLCHDAAVSLGSSFRSSVTSAKTSDAADALKNVFGYSCANVVAFDKECTAEDLASYVIPDLEAQRPVIMGIGTLGQTGGGHCVVVDGYGRDADGVILLHLNLGFCGKDNGWYATSGFSFPTSGSSYESIRQLVYNIVPDTAEPVEAADYVLISPADFVTSWTDYIASRRLAHPELTFAVKNADEIYRDFPGADPSEQIRAYVRSIVARGTKYVVLGGAWSDPTTIAQCEESFIVAGQNGDKYGQLTLTTANTIPGFLRTFSGKTLATDYAYALVDDDELPDVVVSRIPLVPWPKADGSVATFAEMIAGYGEKVRAVESETFAGRHRYACAGAQLGSSVARGSAYWPTERHAYADRYYDFSDPRHPDTATDGEIAARRRFRDYFAMLNPVKGAMVVPVGSSATDFLADASGWEAIVAKCHGLEGEAYGTGLNDSRFRETSTLVKFGIFAMPCLTGRPDRSVTWNGWTSCRCPSMGVAAICNPRGGEVVGFHNTHDGAGKNDVALVTSNGDPYATQYESLLLEAMYRKRLNAGEAWKTAHADYVGRFGTATWHLWTVYESVLYGDPLICPSAIDEAVCGAGAAVPRVLFR